MRFWMDVMRHLEPVMADYERLFDGWEAGGVDGLVLGPMNFQETGPSFHGTATFTPNPSVYAELGVEPPASPAQEYADRRRLLEQMLTAAHERGWTILIFQAQSGAGTGGEGHHLVDAKSQAATIARMCDCLQHYPMVDGAIMDGPEWGYEITPEHMDHRSYFFRDLPETLAGKCAEMGYDYAALVAAKDRLFQRLHSLTPRDVAVCAGGGLFGALELFGRDPDLVAWFRFRSELLMAYFRGIREGLDAHAGRKVKLGVGPRTPAFAPLCGYDLRAMAGIVDILLPKHYFWHRGFDGLYGTVERYVRTLTRWSPELSDADALAVTALLFGIEMPWVQSRRDLDAGFPPEFFETIVKRETRAALAAMGDPERVVPWVDAGRKPHDGDPFTAADLRQTLEAAAEEGLTRFLYHHQENLSPSEWAVMSDLCGQAWQDGEAGYQPPDEPVL